MSVGGERGVAVLDHDVLGRLGHDLGDPELVREVVELYLSQLDQRHKAMIDAVDAADVARVRREAHTLSSASAMIGALKLRDVCRQLEHADVAPGQLAGDPRVLAWPRVCGDTRAALTDWLART